MTILNATDTSPNRLVEMLAGSASLLADPTNSITELPISLSPLADDGGVPTAGADASAQTPDGGLLDTLNLLNASATADAAPPAAPADHADGLLAPVTALLDGVAPDSNVGGLTDILGVANVAGTDTASHSPLDLAGSDGTVQPVFDATNALIKDVHTELEILSHQTGTSDIVHGVTSLGETVGLGEIGVTPDADGHSNLITDIVNAPGDVLAGDVDGVISNIGHDLTDTIHATTGLVDNVLNGTDPTNPIPELINSLGHDLQSLPLLTINNDDTGGLLGAVVGDLSHSSSNHLIDASVGQPSDQQGLVANLLAAPEGGAHSPVDVNAVDVGPSGPHLLDLAALTGSDAINIPGLGGAGADGLVGNVLGPIGSGGGDTSPLAPVTQIVDSAVHDLVPDLLSADHGLLDTHGTHLI